MFFLRQSVFIILMSGFCCFTCFSQELKKQEARDSNLDDFELGAKVFSGSVAILGVCLVFDPMAVNNHVYMPELVDFCLNFVISGGFLLALSGACIMGMSGMCITAKKTVHGLYNLVSNRQDQHQKNKTSLSEVTRPVVSGIE